MRIKLKRDEIYYLTHLREPQGKFEESLKIAAAGLNNGACKCKFLFNCNGYGITVEVTHA